MASNPINTQDLKIVMSKASAAARTQDITNSTAAKPAQLTVSGTAYTGGAAIGNNDIIYVPDCHAQPNLGRGWYLATGVGAGQLVATGSDTVGETWKAGETVTSQFWKDADLVEVCASSIDVQRSNATWIDAPTFCNRSQAVKSAVVEYGTVTFSGYVDVGSDTYKELHQAYITKGERFFGVIFGSTLANAITSKQNLVAMKGTVQSIDFEVPVDGAIAFTAEVKLASPAQHVIAL